MKDDFAKTAGLSVVIILALIFGAKLPPSFAKTRIGRVADKSFAKIRKPHFKGEDLEALDAGYYEGLRKEGSVDPSLQFRNDFLEYDYKTNLRLEGPGLGRTTNSFGMFDQEYTVEKPPHVWRIALLGDSMGLGPFGQNYESLLEKHLNESHPATDIQKFEVLNFAIGGYRITQIMEAMSEKAARFHPDVYLVAITSVSVSHRWSYHIGHLLQRKIDLKYDFLRQVIADAQVEPTDSMETMDRKLTPYTPVVFHWCLEQMKKEASKEGTKMVILFIPEPISQDVLATQFAQARQITDKLGVPRIDLLDTFNAVQNLLDYRVSRDDLHFNARGHELVYENLYRKIVQDPKLSAIVLGTRTSETSARTWPSLPTVVTRRLVPAPGNFGRVALNLICVSCVNPTTKGAKGWWTKSKRKSGNTF